MERIEKKIFDGERALYEGRDLHLVSCRFEGEADGESALKESRRILAEDCVFSLRYPLWHDDDVRLVSCELTDTCRAPLWYSHSVRIESCRIHGTKALRECRDCEIKNSDLLSDEFGWRSGRLTLSDTQAEGAYFMFCAHDLRMDRVTFKGKYSFQYVSTAVLENCVLDTKDAFWHAENVTVRNSVVKGEYLGWYSKNLTFENCVITGTQPLCYCQGLKLINCEMHDCDLAFEKSDVEASVTTPILSVKNVLSGRVTAPSIGEIICDGAQYKGLIQTEK
ncbi:MAG: DUF3737 family protein [Clostridia bacterium]|nr:DUF3737 family protein [Clostridia bacterium]